MTIPAGYPPVAWTLLSIPATGGHGSARLDAVAVIVEALGCRVRSRDLLTGYRQRGAHGDLYLTVWGPEPVVRWLNRALPGIIAALGKAAAASTRGYAAWLRDRCPPEDHMPAERPALRAHWHREYLRAYGATLAARIKGHRLPASEPSTTDERYRSHCARPAAEHDARHASLAPYTPPPARLTEDSPLRALPTGTGPQQVHTRERHGLGAGPAGRGR